MPVWMEKDNTPDETVFSTDTVVEDVDVDDSCTLSADGFLIADALEHEVGILEEFKSKALGNDLLVSLVWETPVGLTNPDY